MYYFAKKDISKFDKEEYPIAKDLRKKFNVDPSNNLETVEISFEIGYQRKANAIHKWIVDNCADGMDDCREIYIDIEKIKELQFLIRSVLDGKIKPEDALETQKGFFFGSEKYDDEYKFDLEEALKILTKLADYESRGFYIYYRASW